MILNRDSANSNAPIFGVVIHNHGQRGEYTVDDVKWYKCYREGRIKAIEPSYLINKLEYDHQKGQQGKGYAGVQAVMIENEDEYGKNNNQV